MPFLPPKQNSPFVKPAPTTTAPGGSSQLLNAVKTPRKPWLEGVKVVDQSKVNAKVASGVGNANAPSGPQAEMDKLRQDIMNSHQSQWAGIQSGINANTALQSRRAAEINAGMGRSVAGGFGGMMAQAMLGGQQNMLNAGLEHQRQGQNLQMDFLDQQIRRNERSEDRQFALAQMGGETPTLGGAGSTKPGEGVAGAWEGHGGQQVTAGYVARHYAKKAAERGTRLDPAQQAAIEKYISSYYARTGKYPDMGTISRNAGTTVTMKNDAMIGFGGNF